MARKKKVETEDAVQAAVETEEVTQPEIKLPKGWALVVAVYNDLVDPFQNKRFPHGEQVATELTSWVECQIAGGVMKRVK